MQHLATLGLGFAAYIGVSVLHVVYLTSCHKNSKQKKGPNKASLAALYSGMKII